MKTIALFDYQRGGHHLTYLRVFSKILLEMGYRVMTFCQETDELNEWLAVHCPNHIQQLHTFKVQELKAPVLPIISQLPRTFVVLAQWKYAGATIERASRNIGYSPDLVFFNYLDSYLNHYLSHHIIDRIFPYTWSGLHFLPSYSGFQQRFLPILRTPVTPYAVTQSSRCCGIAVLEEMESKKLQHTIKKPVITFPDITDESPPDINYPIAKLIREKAGNRKIIGLFGFLSKRKGLLTLLEVTQKLTQENLFFVFAGRFYESDLLPEEVSKVWTIVKSEPSNCFFHFERIPEETQFNALIDVCDILFAAYVNFSYSSNILTKAAVFKKPVIVSDGFCMGERVKKFQLGVTIPAEDVTKCIEALRYLEHQLDSNFSHLKPDFEGYRRIHSTEQLRTTLDAICNNVVSS